MKKTHIIIIILLLLVPINIKAASMSISCDNLNPEANQIVRCSVNISDTEVSGGEGTVQITNGTIRSVIKNSCSQGEATTSSFTCVDEVRNGSMSLVTYVIEVGNSETTVFSITGAKVVGYDFATISTSVPSANISIKEKVVTPPHVDEPVNNSNNTNTNTNTNTNNANTIPQTIETPKEETPKEEEPVPEEAKERHGLKSFKILDNKEYKVDEESSVYTIEYIGELNNLNFTYETYSEEDSVVVDNETINNGFNKVTIKYSYKEEVKEYTLYIYKALPIKESTKTKHGILYYILCFFAGIAIAIFVKSVPNKQNNSSNAQTN